MKTLYYSKFLACFLVLLTVACNDNKILNPTEVIPQDEIMLEDLTIESAQQYFNTKVKPLRNGRNTVKKDLLWSNATQWVEKNGSSVVSIPVVVDPKDMNFTVAFKDDEATKRKKELDEKNYRENNLSTPQKLLIIRDNKGKMHSYLVKIIADYDYFEKSMKKNKYEKAKNNAKDFDGLVIFQDWNEKEIIEGLQYEKGILKKIATQNVNIRNGRITSLGCGSFSIVVSFNCNQARVSQEFSNSCSVTYDYHYCNLLGDGGGSMVGAVIPSFSQLISTSGGGSPSGINSSYRENVVDNFLIEANQNGTIFGEDERLDFINNFDNFLKLREDLLSAIRQWGNQSIQWFEDQLREQISSIKDGERNLLRDNGPFSSYRINLMLHVVNAWRAGNIANTVMSSLGLNGSFGKNCGECRGNAIKHATWILFNCNTFGKWLAESLGSAHEVGEPNGSRRNMDLHNNSIGVLLFDNFGVFGALPKLGDILNNGMPNNSSNGFKFLIPNGNNNNEPLLWTKDYPNEN